MDQPIPLPMLDFPFLKVKYIAERWSGIKGYQVTQEQVIEYGVDGSLEFVIQDGDWNKTDRALILYPDSSSGGVPFDIEPLSTSQLKQICSTKVDLRLKDIFDDISKNKELNKSRNRYVTKDCLFISRKVLEAFEEKLFDKNGNKDLLGVTERNLGVFRNMTLLSYDEITITFIEDGCLEIKARGKKKSFQLGELDLFNKHNKQPNKQAEYLLKFVGRKKTIKTGSKQVKSVSLLNKLISGWFPIDGKAIVLEGYEYRCDINILEELTRTSKNEEKRLQVTGIDIDRECGNDKAAKWLEEHG